MTKTTYVYSLGMGQPSPLLRISPGGNQGVSSAAVLIWGPVSSSELTDVFGQVQFFAVIDLKPSAPRVHPQPRQFTT